MFILLIIILTYIIINSFLNTTDLILHNNPNIFYSPFTGTIRKIYIKNNHLIISGFLNIFDNHSQYIPIKSLVLNIQKIGHGHRLAFKEHSINNEQIISTLSTGTMTYSIKQISGILTRRIFNYLQKNKEYNSGSIFGLILLGSRVDIEIPLVNVNQLKIQNYQHINAGDVLLTLK